VENPQALTIVFVTALKTQRSVGQGASTWWSTAPEAVEPHRHWNAVTLALLGDAVSVLSGLITCIWGLSLQALHSSVLLVLTALPFSVSVAIARYGRCTSDYSACSHHEVCGELDKSC
jgi:ABC-type spermidine/putrescine transport system permease subunit I